MTSDRMPKPEIYCMTDVEADGKAPGISSMLSFATAAFDIDKNLIGVFEANLNLLDGAKPHPDTSEFWRENPRAYAATRVNPRDPLEAMTAYAEWLADLLGTPIFVGYPAAFDFKWIDWYFIKFLDNNPFRFSRVVDVKSFAWAQIARGSFQSCSKSRMPREWFDDLPHTHIALDDAIEQGALFINMLRENRGLDAISGVKIS